MKVLVTGGGGFIGAWISRALAEAGITPVVLDRNEDRSKLAEIAGVDFAAGLGWVAADIADTDAVIDAATGCDGIIHLAGLLTPACKADPILGAKVNLLGTLNAFIAAQRHGMKSVIYMSSAGVFGPDGGDEPHPTTLYGAYKLACENSARAFYEDHGIASVGFRPFVVYGPGRDAGLSAGPTLACRAAAQAEDYTIPFSGEIDMIHVADVAAIFVEAVQARLGGAHVINLIGHRVSAQDVAEAIAAQVPGTRIDASGPPMPIVSPASDPTLGKLFPDWAPLSLSEGIADTIDFYRRQA